MDYDIFPEVKAALADKDKDKGKSDFERIARKAGVTQAAIGGLWEHLVAVETRLVDPDELARAS